MATDFEAAFIDARVLMALGMFLFGMDSLAYSEFTRRMDWRHESSPRFQARPASQFVGPGDDKVTLTGLLVPEVSGSYTSIDRLIEMANTGGNWPLVDGFGRVWGDFRIAALDQRGSSILAGGIARVMDFAIDLERVDG